MRKYDVAAYIWPSYHYEPRVEHFWPEKNGEWYTVKRGISKFPGHDMPRIPLLGYQDEADPAVMEQQVKLAAQHGVNTFIMDWYWYDNEPCFERQLNEGLIPALEGTDSKFYLMWANHNATTLWDMHTDKDDPVFSAKVTRKELEPMFDRIIDNYLKLDSYYCINGKPVFSIFLTSPLIESMGGVKQTNEIFAWMEQRCIEKGLPGLHLQAIARKGGGGVEDGSDQEAKISEIAKELKYSSATSYQYAMDSGGKGDYVVWADNAISFWNDFEDTYGTYYPHASIGWDNTQRYPSVKNAVMGATPDAFEACLWKAKQYLDDRPEQTPLITINSWNEWTEGSYLLPDMRWGYRYLQAVKNVFC